MEREVDIYVGKRLRARRITLGLNQEAVGKGIGVAPQQIQKYEKGTNALNAARIVEIAAFLKVPASYFFEGLPQNGEASVISASTEFSHEGSASDREAIECIKSFRRIKDSALRKRAADLLRTLAVKGM